MGSHSGSQVAKYFQSEDSRAFEKAQRKWHHTESCPLWTDKHTPRRFTYWWWWWWCYSMYSSTPLLDTNGTYFSLKYSVASLSRVAYANGLVWIGRTVESVLYNIIGVLNSGESIIRFHVLCKYLFPTHSKQRTCMKTQDSFPEVQIAC